MKVVITWDGDHIGRMVGRARMADQVEEVRRVGQAIDQGNEVWKSWVSMNGGSIIEMGGDEGSAEILAEKLGELPKIRTQYAECVHSTVSVGVGTKLSEADKALMVAKFRGGNAIVLFTEELNDEIEQAQKKEAGRTEVDKLSEEYLTKGQKYYHATFQDHAAAIGSSGTIRIPEGKPAHRAKVFATTEPAASAQDIQLQHGRHDPVVTLEFETDHPHQPGAGNIVTWPHDIKVKNVRTVPTPSDAIAKAQPASNEGPAAGFSGASKPSQPSVAAPQPEGSEHSQGETAQNMLDKDNPGPVEGTHAGADFEDLFHDLAGDQKAKDDTQGQAAPGSSQDQTRLQIVQVLQALKAQAPILEQVKQSAPDTYKAVMALAQAVIVMARQMNGEPAGQQGQRETEDRARSQAQLEVPLPPEEGEDKKESKGEDTKKAEKEADWVDCDEHGHTYGSELLSDYCLMCTGHREEHDREAAEKLEKDSLSPGVGKPVAQHHHLVLPVGSHVDPGPTAQGVVGRIKVEHNDAKGKKAGWVQARAGQVLSQDGHAISSRNPGGK